MRLGMKTAIATLKGYEPDKKVIGMDNEEYPGMLELVVDPMVAAKDADVIFTDLWSSMGQESEAQDRKKVFEGIYQINDKVLSVAKPDCMIQHCLPAHRGEEITEDVFESHAAEIFEEAESPLHEQKILSLKEKIYKLYPNFVRSYNAKWNKETKKVENLDPLMDLIKEDLEKIFTYDIEKNNSLDWQERAILASHEFYKEKIKFMLI